MDLLTTLTRRADSLGEEEQAGLLMSLAQQLDSLPPSMDEEALHASRVALGRGVPVQLAALACAAAALGRSGQLLLTADLVREVGRLAFLPHLPAEPEIAQRLIAAGIGLLHAGLRNLQRAVGSLAAAPAELMY